MRVCLDVTSVPVCDEICDEFGEIVEKNRLEGGKKKFKRKRYRVRMTGEMPKTERLPTSGIEKSKNKKKREKGGL
jgi:hypothetical protein